MAQPKKLKFRRQFKRRAKAVSPRGTSLAFGDFGLKVLGSGFLTEKEIEAGRRAVAHFTKREGKIWIRVFTDKPVTRKAAGTRMGGGKGETDHFVAGVTAGRIIYEIAGVEKEIAQEALRRAGHKISLRTTFVERK